MHQKSTINTNKIIVKKDSVALQLNNIRIEYSKPQIQAFNEYRLNDKEDILHFYYDVVITKKNYERKIEKIARGSAYDFGIAAYIEDYVNSVLETDMTKNSIKMYLNDPDEEVDETEYILTKYFELSGMLNEDTINIKRMYKTFEDCEGRKEFEYYDVYFGTSGSDFDNTSNGVLLTNLYREDIELIREFGKKFVELAIKKQQGVIEGWLNSDEDSEYNNPKIFREHLKNKYGETDWKDKFIKLNDTEYVFEEYMEYIKGEKTEDELECHEWHGKERSMPELLKEMKDYEAYLHIAEDNHY